MQVVISTLAGILVLLLLGVTFAYFNRKSNGQLYRSCCFSIDVSQVPALSQSMQQKLKSAKARGVSVHERANQHEGLAATSHAAPVESVSIKITIPSPPSSSTLHIPNPMRGPGSTNSLGAPTRRRPSSGTPTIRRILQDDTVPVPIPSHRDGAIISPTAWGPGNGHDITTPALSTSSVAGSLAAFLERASVSPSAQNAPTNAAPLAGHASISPLLHSPVPFPKRATAATPLTLTPQPPRADLLLRPQHTPPALILPRLTTLSPEAGRRRRSHSPSSNVAGGSSSSTRSTSRSRSPFHAPHSPFFER
jgi:hypothetical protein